MSVPYILFDTIEIIEKRPDKPWDWKDISRNPNITMEIIDKYPNKPWDWGVGGISQNPNLTIEFIEKHSNKPWDMTHVCKNKFSKWRTTTINLMKIKHYVYNCISI